MTNLAFSAAAPPPAVAARNRILCVAPMMRYSHRHARHFWRLLSPTALLYTEMLTAQAIIHGRRDKLLSFTAIQNPLALQIGGSDPKTVADAARIGQDWGYAEININCGCPSSRVQNGAFGACLMREPATVADIVTAARAAVTIPITVKCRIAVDDMDCEHSLTQFAAAVADSGAAALIVHARRALLNGLSPAQNRAVPPLNHPRVYRLKQEFPNLPIIINGSAAIGGEDAAARVCAQSESARAGGDLGDDARDASSASDDAVDIAAAVGAHLRYVDGVMLGRAITRQPYLLAEAERDIHGGIAPARAAVLARMLDYIGAQPANEQHRALTCLSALYFARPHNKVYRRALALPAAQAIPTLRNLVGAAGIEPATFAV